MKGVELSFLTPTDSSTWRSVGNTLSCSILHSDFIDCGWFRPTQCQEPRQWNDSTILLMVNINFCVGGGCATHSGLFTWLLYESISVFAESHTKGFLLCTYTIGHPCDNKSPFRHNWNSCGECELATHFPFFFPPLFLKFVLYQNKYLTTWADAIPLGWY